LEWVWWNERVRVSSSAAASCTDPAPAKSKNEDRPKQKPALDNDDGLNWRAKPASTYDPTLKTTDPRTLSLPRVAKEVNAFLIREG